MTDVSEKMEVHPWRRYFARLLDMVLMGSLFYAGLAVLAPTLEDAIMQTVTKYRILDTIFTGFFVMLLNPISISLTGTTFGKYVFGVKLLDRNDKKLPFLTALKREFLVYTKGLAFCIPIISIFTLWIGYSKLNQKGKTSWDETLKCNVMYRENNLKQKILNISGVAVLLLVVFLIVLSRQDSQVSVAMPLLQNTQHEILTYDPQTGKFKEKGGSQENQTINAENQVLTFDPQTGEFYEKNNSGKNQLTEETIKNITEAMTINAAKERGYVGRNKYIAALSDCSDRGNIYCSGVLGDFYYKESEYSLAYPLLLKSTKMQFGAQLIEYELGYMLNEGYGILKNENEALSHLEKAAALGSSDGAYSLGVIYGNRALALVKKSPSDPGVKSFFIQSYAWYKVAKALGHEIAVNSDSQIQDIDSSIERQKELLIESAALEGADDLAAQICSAIEQCEQDHL